MLEHALKVMIRIIVYCLAQGDALVTYDIHSGDAAFGAERLVRIQILTAFLRMRCRAYRSALSYKLRWLVLDVKLVVAQWSRPAPWVENEVRRCVELASP